MMICRILQRAALMLMFVAPAMAAAQVDSSRTDSLRVDTLGVDSSHVDRTRLDSSVVTETKSAVPAGSRPSVQSLVLVTGDVVEELRIKQLTEGVPSGKSLLLRSATSMTRLLSPADQLPGVSVILPQLLAVWNSNIPFSQNNSAMWAGRGTSTRTLTGFTLVVPHLRMLFAPQFIVSQNGAWRIQKEVYSQPQAPNGYGGGGYTLPYIYYTFPIDQPLRFGNDPVKAFNWGESTLSVNAAWLEAGISNENEWWGPGIRNAMILSNNAPGFPHTFLRTTRPLKTPVGGIELRWLAGELRESAYFDTLDTNNYRSLAAIAATLQTRWDPNLTVGFARSVYATARKSETIPVRFFDVFKRAGRRNSELLTEIWNGEPIPSGTDQIFSLFARWVFPKSGAEVYGEWGRTRIPASFTELLVAPNHTQGYTIGMQWRGNAWSGGSVRVQGEITQQEQSATFRDGPVGSWYTSSRVIQGYTNRGQVIGASNGPGSSSQFLALDYLKSSWRFGAFAGRIRWNEDVHSTYGFPDYVSYCSHDVTIYPGIRGALFGGFGSISADLALQNRMNAFFQNSGGCPNVGTRLDIRNTSLTIRFEPLRRR